MAQEDTKLKGNGRVSDTVRSYADDPFFVKKAEEAAETLKRVGLPDSKGIISDTVRNHANDPFFVKKNAEAKEALSKIDLSVLKKK